MKRFIILIVCIAFMTGISYAHDAWIEKKDGQFIVVYGHGTDTESYDAAKVKEAKAYGADGKIIQVAVEKAGYPVMIKSKDKPALISMVFDNGFWAKTPDGWKNKPKKDVPDAIETSQSLKYSKALLHWNNKFSKPLGMKMEIVPLRNPLALKTGDTFDFRVLLDGNPAPGAAVNAGGYHGDEIKTDQDGIARVKIKEAGFQIISASIKTPLKNNENADVLTQSANIRFEVK
jgi:nickel transport protein